MSKLFKISALLLIIAMLLSCFVACSDTSGEDGSAAPLTGSETEIPSGSYRLAYSVQNGDRSISGYVYVDYLCGSSSHK